MGHISEQPPVAVVTGASGGMGGEIARDLSRTHRVIALGRNREALDTLAADRGANYRIDTRQVDLTDAAAVDAAVANVDRVDVLVHAAAISRSYSVAEAEASEDDWDLQLRTNVIAPALLTRALLPQLRLSHGTVVFIGSGAGTRPVSGSVVYTASKHALRGMADVLRIDEESHRLRVVTLAPGQTDTAMLRGVIADAGALYEPERYITAASVASVVRFVVDAPADIHLTDLAVRPRQEISRL